MDNYSYDRTAVQNTETMVWLKMDRHQIEVAVVGIDARIIASVESGLRDVAEEMGASIDDEHPRSLRSVGWLRKPAIRAIWSYSGFTAEDEPDYIMDLAKALGKEAKKWHVLAQIGRGSWPMS